MKKPLSCLGVWLPSIRMAEKNPKNKGAKKQPRRLSVCLGIRQAELWTHNVPSVVKIDCLHFEVLATWHGQMILFVLFQRSCVEIVCLHYTVFTSAKVTSHCNSAHCCIVNKTMLVASYSVTAIFVTLKGNSSRRNVSASPRSLRAYFCAILLSRALDVSLHIPTDNERFILPKRRAIQKISPQCSICTMILCMHLP